MAVSIRLRRIGRKKQPSYRVVVTDSSRPRDGAYLESLGHYNPTRQPAELRLDLDRVDVWVERGAELSDTVKSLIRKARKGGDRKISMVAAPSAAPAPVAEPAATSPAPAARSGAGAPVAEPSPAAESAPPAEAAAPVEPASPVEAEAPVAEAHEPAPE
jgi:small subunit ribosomal protein S16